MSTLTLHGSFAPLSEADLRKLELRLGFQLPDDYREFLLKTNGGFLHHENEDPETGCGISYFCGVGVEGTACNLEEMNKTRAYEIDDDLIAIAANRVDDDICLSTRTPKFGQVCISRSYSSLDDGIDFGYGDDIQDGTDEPEFIASSLSEFLARLELRVPPIRPDLLDLRDTLPQVRAAFESVHAHDVEGLKATLDDGLDPNSRSTNGKTLLNYAAHRCRLPSIELLLRRGADVNLTTRDGKSSVRMAAYAGCVDCLRLLYKNGADLDKADSKGVTPLLDAIQSRGLRIVAALLELGASPHGEAPDGKSYLQVIQETYSAGIQQQDGDWLTKKFLAAGCAK